MPGSGSSGSPGYGLRSSVRGATTLGERQASMAARARTWGTKRVVSKIGRVRHRVEAVDRRKHEGARGGVRGVDRVLTPRPAKSRFPALRSSSAASDLHAGCHGFGSQVGEFFAGSQQVVLDLIDVGECQVGHQSMIGHARYRECAVPPSSWLPREAVSAITAWRRPGGPGEAFSSTSRHWPFVATGGVGRDNCALARAHLRWSS